MMPDSEIGRNWITPQMGLDALAAGDGAGVKVAIIDSGIEADHPALSKLKIADRLAVTTRIGKSHVEEDGEGDVYGHGTAVAGIVHRIAPQASIGSFRVLRPNGVPTEPLAIRGAVLEALARGYQIINCSFGSPGRSGDVLVFKDWIDRAYLAGAHAVAACGNLDPDEREWPSHFSSLISVGVAACGEGEIHNRPGHIVEFAAAGESRRVPWKGGGEKAVLGSSFAAPQVSGLIARILSKHPEISPPLMKALLREVASPVRGCGSRGAAQMGGKPALP
jgi:subtilisin family serine protease